MTDTLQTLILYAFVGLIVLLRLDAQRFGAAEYDDEEAPGGWTTWLRRLSWYGFGIVLVILVYRLHPLPISVLHLQMGADRGQTLIVGLALAAIGTLIAFVYAYLRFGGLRLPPGRRYPAGLLNSVGTAFIDEAAFRGILLGLLLTTQWPVELTIALQAVIYGLATRLGAGGRPLGPLLLSLAIGLVGGWVTLATLGIGASFLGHALTRMALFVATGHAGQLQSASDEEPMDDRAELTPDGWEIVSDRDPGMGPQYR
ncbi:MAG TPA: CPBP family glutamic-type intramembrane protease [Candidatus Caenarcaniphilales bacterium]|nr:CPBP family glutamic-type intramembrane protease [Candidatus Caenarcaniphilales bacterium]